jgi:hypothetical protein
MRRLAAIAAALACAALLCASPLAVAATPSESRLAAAASRANRGLELLGRVSAPLGLPRNSSIAVLKLENRDGYEIFVVAFGQTVALTVSRAGDPSAVTVYLAHGRVTPVSIRASFAERGRIGLRLRSSAQALRLPRRPGCALPGGIVVGRTGVYVGELSFQGEGGYTSARVHRVKGTSIDLGALSSCLGGLGRKQRRAALPPARFPGLRTATADGRAPAPPGVPTHPSTGPKPTALVADAKLPLVRTVFAARARGSSRPRFLATEEASEGPLGVVRYAFVPGPRAAFAFDGPLSLAGVTPPPPFSGTATFQHGPRATKSWTGSLAVSFLGAPDVPLTGSSFKAQLTRGW